MKKSGLLAVVAAILIAAWTLSCGDDGGAPAVTCIDNDGDTYGQNCSAGPDCNDSDASVHPGAAEVTCDGVDNDCSATTLDAPDGDGDTWDICEDCNDDEVSIHLWAFEICGDGIDQNCDESLICDGGVIDADGDEYGSIPSGGTDCDDSDISIHPGVIEVTCDGVDNDCSATTLDAPDGDGDTWDICEDCNDDEVSIYPGAPELCDGIDHQCPGDTGYGLIYDECTVGAMALIPAGCFDMGDHFSEGDSDELPVHNVCISAFAMDVHEVTNVEYKACVNASVCSAPSDSGSATRASYYGNPSYDDYPVIYVDWNQATAYCSWAGKRLPTEAEWEYAARGGLSGQRYPWGDTISGTDANYWDSGDPWDNDTSQVEYYAANGYGLFDMAGNVWEWVNDWYQSDYYSESPTNDPPGPASGTYRVLRGGSYIGDAIFLRASIRVDLLPSNQDYYFGFRCAGD